MKNVIISGAKEQREGKITAIETRRIFAPTPEEVSASRERVAEIMKVSRRRPHPFTSEDFEAAVRELWNY